MNPLQSQKKAHQNQHALLTKSIHFLLKASCYIHTTRTRFASKNCSSTADSPDGWHKNEIMELKQSGSHDVIHGINFALIEPHFLGKNVVFITVNYKNYVT